MVREDPLDAGISRGLTQSPTAHSATASSSGLESGRSGVDGPARSSREAAAASQDRLQRSGSVGSGGEEMDVVTGDSPRRGRQDPSVRSAQTEVTERPYAQVSAPAWEFLLLSDYFLT